MPVIELGGPGWAPSRRQIAATAALIGAGAVVRSVRAGHEADQHQCTWSGPATETGGQWTRSAVTDGWFAGPAVPPGKVDGATILPYGTHSPEVIVEHPGGTIIAAIPPRFWITRT